MVVCELVCGRAAVLAPPSLSHSELEAPQGSPLVLDIRRATTTATKAKQMNNNKPMTGKNIDLVA